MWAIVIDDLRHDYGGCLPSHHEAAMQPTGGPIRITIDVHPHLLGRGGPAATVRESGRAPTVADTIPTLPNAEPVATDPMRFEPSAAEVAECSCPDACERDHANE
jgi:hypothetical protein